MNIKDIWSGIVSAIGEKAAAVLLSKMITKENIKKLVAGVLNQAEKLAKKTDTKIDDQIVRKIKDVLDIP